MLPKAYIDKIQTLMKCPFVWTTPGKFRLVAALRQSRLTDSDKRKRTNKSKDLPKVRSIHYESGRTIDIDVADFKGHPLWPLLIETARNNPLFPGNAGYAHKYIIPEDPTITPKELASKLSITVGEALAILEGYEPKS
jgi:hypothetical protein